jgi:hypothetical protein
MGIGELIDIVRAEKERRIREIRLLEAAEAEALAAARQMTERPDMARAWERRARAALLRALLRVGREVEHVD